MTADPNNVPKQPPKEPTVEQRRGVARFRFYLGLFMVVLNAGIALALHSPFMLIWCAYWAAYTLWANSTLGKLEGQKTRLQEWQEKAGKKP